MKNKHDKRIFNNYLITNTDKFIIPSSWIVQITEQEYENETVVVNISRNDKLHRKEIYIDGKSLDIRKWTKTDKFLINRFEDLYDICYNWQVYEEIEALGDYTGLADKEMEIRKKLIKVNWKGKI